MEEVEENLMGRERSLEPRARHTPGTDTSAPALTADALWCPRLGPRSSDRAGRGLLLKAGMQVSGKS